MPAAGGRVCRRIRPLVLERLEAGWTPAESELEALLLATLAQLPSHPTDHPPGHTALAQRLAPDGLTS